MLQEKISGGFRIAVILFAVSIIHFLGSILSNFWVLSDLLLVMGAFQAVNLLRDEDARENVSEAIEEFQIGTLADGLTFRILELLSMVGINVDVDDDDDDLDEEELETLKKMGLSFVSLGDLMDEEEVVGDDLEDIAV